MKDKDAIQDFVAAYTQMHRWREIVSGGEMLYIGADNAVFPIPLGRNSSGQWQFDTDAGRDEILARRIGRDELTAITACGAIASAQNQYFSQTHDGRTRARKQLGDKKSRERAQTPKRKIYIVPTNLFYSLTCVSSSPEKHLANLRAGRRFPI